VTYDHLISFVQLPIYAVFPFEVYCDSIIPFRREGKFVNVSYF